MQSKDLEIVERLMLISPDLVVAVDEGSFLPLGKLAHEAALVIIRLRKQVEELKEKSHERG